MIQGWIKNILVTASHVLGQGAQIHDKKARRQLSAKTDEEVTEGSYTREFRRKKSLDLMALLKQGGTSMDKLLSYMRLRTRRRVKRELIPPFADIPEIIDEVTERLVRARKHDRNLDKKLN